MHSPDPAHDLWDFDDPVASEARFREAARQALSPARQVLLSQVARALGLQQRYDEAHAVLEPSETRPRLIADLEVLRHKERPNLPRKHSCGPL